MEKTKDTDITGEVALEVPVRDVIIESLRVIILTKNLVTSLLVLLPTRLLRHSTNVQVRGAVQWILLTHLVTAVLLRLQRYMREILGMGKKK